MKMNNLSICIQEVARDDSKTTKAITAEINEYLHGDKRFDQLTVPAQYAVQLASTGNDDEICYNKGRFSFSDMALFV